MTGADLRNLDALLHLRNALLRFREATSDVEGQLQTRIDRVETALLRQMSRLRSEIEEQSKIWSSSEDGKERRRAQRAMQDAQEELANLERRARALSVAVAQYKRAIPSWRHAMQSDLPAAAAFLAKKHADADDYLNVSVTSGSIELGVGAGNTNELRSQLLPRNAVELRMAANDADLFLLRSEEATDAHPIERHVGKSELYLAIRLAMESDGAVGLRKKRPIPAASTFLTDAEQAAAVSKALTDPRNADKIDKWINGGYRLWRDRSLTTEFSGGRVIRRGGGEPEKGTHALVLLRRIETGEVVVWTAYPVVK